MTSMARRAMRVTAAVTGVAALGTGFAGNAFAAEPAIDFAAPMDLLAVNTASVDGFDTESIAPTEALSGDFAETIVGATSSQGASTASSPIDPATAGALGGFHFEMPPTQFATAGEEYMGETGLASLGHMDGVEMPALAAPTAGEAQSDQLGLTPMMRPMMEHAVPAITGQQVGVASEGQSFGSDNGLPEPVDGPVNEVTGPVTSSVMPALAMMTAAVTDSTSNNDSTSDHSVEL